MRVGHANGPDSAARGPSISGDGAVVAYSSRFDGVGDAPFLGVWLWSRGTTPKRVDRRQSGPAQGDGDSTAPQLSLDGAVVVFRSAAAGIVVPDTNGVTDAFLYDVRAGTTVRLSQSAAGIAGNGTVFDVSISPDGQRASFSSAATNLVGADTNGQPDAFVFDGGSRAVSSPTASVPADGPSASVRAGSGGILAFRSAARNLIAGETDATDYDDVFFVDAAGGLARVSTAASGGPANGESRAPALGGGFVAFVSEADDLVEGDTNGAADVFVRDVASMRTERVSVGDSGEEPNGGSDAPSISEDGRFVAFRSSATNLVSGDAAGHDDVFIRDRLLSRTFRVTTTLDGIEASGNSGAPALSADGRFVAFESEATNLTEALDGPLTPGVMRIFRARVR